MRSEWRRNKTYAMDRTDRLEQELIKGLQDLYRDAAKDVQKLADEFHRQHEAADERMKAELEAGNIKKEYYRQWRQVQMGRGKRWDTMKAQMADRMNNADKQAAAFINNSTPSIYALNHDYTCFQIDQAGIMEGGSFTLVNERTIRELALGGNHVNFRTMRPDPIRNYNWNAQRIQRTLAVGLLSGKSTGKIANDFLQLMGGNRKAAVRNARTAVTSAQNAGCQAAFDEAKDMGIQLKKEWMCTHDSRTRESHAEMDGERVENEEAFSNGLMYPGDPEGEPAEVYNCRCTMRAVLPYMEQAEKSGGLIERMYAEWRDQQETEGEAGQRTLEGEERLLEAGEAEPEEETVIEEAEPETETEEEPEETETEEVPEAEAEPVEEEQEEPLKEPDFKPAETIAEAEEQLGKYVDKFQFGAIGVSFKGVSLEVANVVNRAVGRVFENFDLGMLGGFQSPTANSKVGKMIENAHAAYMPVRRALFLNRRDAKDLEQANEHIRADNAYVMDYFEHPEKYNLSRMPTRARKVLENSEYSGRALVAEDLEIAIYHELGHHVEQMLKKYENTDAIWDEMTEQARNVSGYACDSKSEYIAECFASYMKGEDKIGKETRAFFESIRRK